MQEQNNVLIVDDDPSVRQMLTFILEDEGYKISPFEKATPAIEKLQQSFFNIVITDFQLPDLTGIEVAHKIRQLSPDTCVILMTGHASLEMAVEAIKEDVYDYLIKPVDPEQLKRSIQKALEKQRLTLENRRLLEELKERDARMLELSITDDLTRLFNRRYFYTRLWQGVDIANRQKQSLSLIILDLDGFKKYNDTHGHLSGDALLRKLGEIIQQNVRKQVDAGCRYGGDEMTVVLPEATKEISGKIAERIRKGFEDAHFDEVTISAGIGEYKLGEEPEELVKRVDDALYKSKREGKNRLTFA